MPTSVIIESFSNIHIPRRNPCRRSFGYNKEVSRISPVTKEIFLESMTYKDIINMYKTIQFYFTDEHPDFEGKVFSYLVNQFYMVLKQTDCEIERTSFDGIYSLYIHDIFTDTRNQLFQKYSELFDFFSVKYIDLKYQFSEDIPYEYIYPSNLHEIFPKLQIYRISYQFSEDIPYEYIYPSNLHEIFPKLQIYRISFDYYPELECFRVPYSDLHYKRLYSIYKQNYYNMSSLLLYNTYLKRLTEEKLLELVKKQLVVYTKIDFWKQLKNKIKNVDEHLVRGTLPDEYNNDEYKDYMPPLYVECYSDYSQFPNKLIGLLTFSENYYVDKIASYIYNIPQCKQLNIIKCSGTNKEEAENKCISLSLSIPALLSALNNGIFDNLEKMNISTSVSICDFGSKEILPDLSKNYFKEIIFFIRDSLSQNCDQQLIKTINTINCQKLEEIRIDISSTKSYSYLYDDNQSSSNADIISFQKCLTLFSSNIKYLKINYGCLCDMIYVLQNIMEFPLWINVEELSICFSLVDSIQPILSFIENIHNNPSLSFPKLDSFYIEYLSDPDNSIVKHVDYNILKSFPSLSFYLHIPITEIYMHSQLGKLRKTSFEYCQYIYNQLQMEYTKTVSKLHIILKNNHFSDEIIKLIVNGKFPFLKELQLLSCEENKIDEIEQLIKNYMKTSNHWFIFFIKEGF
ncbi:hypothetical protein WA158_003261 [Blastocystis sp. Blastoise]